MQQAPAPAARTRAWLAVLALFAIVYFGSAFSPHLEDDADSTHAEAAREMFLTHDYVTLHVNGVRYLEKAPLLYWLVAGSYYLFGVNAFAAHLPVVLAMLLLALLAMRWAARAYGGRAAIYAGVFVSTTAGYYLFTRILIPEAILSLLIALSLYWFATAMDDGRAWRWYAGYAALALAVLTKGLLALVVVGGAAVVYLALSGEWRRWREFRLATGLLLFFAIATPWHLLAGFRNPGFFWFYFVNEHFLRFLGERYPKDYNKLPASLYWSLHLLWLFPWSVFLPTAIRQMINDWRARKSVPAAKSGPDFRSRTTLLCIVWAAVLLVFFAFSTNQEYYTVPAYFPILLVLAGAVAREEEIRGQDGHWLTWTATVLALAAVVASGLLIAGLWSSRHLPFEPDIGAVLAKPVGSTGTLSMGHMLQLTDASFAALRLPAIIVAIALPLGSLLALWLRFRRRHWASTWTTAVTMAVFLIAAHIALVRFDPYLSSKNMADVLQRELRPGDRVMIYVDEPLGSSLLFYLERPAELRPIELIDGQRTSVWFGSTFPDAPKIFLSKADLLRAWHSPTRVFLFVPREHRDEVHALPLHPKYVVIESSGKVIYSNRPAE